MAGCHKIAFIDFQNTSSLCAFAAKTRRAHQSPGGWLDSDRITIHAAALCGYSWWDAGIDENDEGEL